MQKAINILDEMIEQSKKWVMINPLQEAKSHIQALGDGWISVSEDSIPTEKWDYICYRHTSSWFYQDILRFDWREFVDFETVQDVTHWMNLPLPPQ